MFSRWCRFQINKRLKLEVKWNNKILLEIWLGAKTTISRFYVRYCGRLLPGRHRHFGIRNRKVCARVRGHGAAGDLYLYVLPSLRIEPFFEIKKELLYLVTEHASFLHCYSFPETLKCLFTFDRNFVICELYIFKINF